MKRVKLPLRERGRSSYIFESEYDLTSRTMDREAQYAFYNLQGISEEQWEPPLQVEDRVALAQAIYPALDPEDLRHMEEIVRTQAEM